MRQKAARRAAAYKARAAEFAAALIVKRSEIREAKISRERRRAEIYAVNAILRRHFQAEGAVD